MRSTFEKLSKDELIELVEIYAKNMLAIDGVWFQSIEQKYGMDVAMEHDRNAWRRYTEIEAKRIKGFLKLTDNSGIEGLKKALSIRFYSALNGDEILVSQNKLIYRTLSCRVQNARTKKGMPLHPCKSVGIIEYTYFAKVIDSRFECKVLSCFPDITDTTCACAWEFSLSE